MTHLNGRYFGQAGPLFGLYIKTALLTILTAGIYRFWAKTRIRKYVWSATAGGEDSFEYTGTGLEKFLGFLVAIVILAVFLGFLNMILAFIGLNVIGAFDGSASEVMQIGVIYANFFALIPLMLYAAYRARRYKMARTRWRGLRFGMDNGAWGYVARALGHGLLTILTLGLLTPRATFYLEKYMADRSWYGDAKFVQGGKWTALYPGMKHLGIALLILVAGIGAAVLIESPMLGSVAGFVGYIWLIVGFAYYRVYAFNYMMGEKVLDGVVTFDAQAKTGRVLTIVLIGMLVVFAAVIGAVVLFGLALAGIGVGFAALFDPASANLGAVTPGAIVGLGILVVVLYVGIILLAGGINLVMITQKIIAHIVGSVTVANAPHLDQIQQRAADTGADAEGFADALDIGGAI